MVSMPICFPDPNSPPNLFHGLLPSSPPSYPPKLARARPFHAPQVKSEIEVMASLPPHPNVLKLIGHCRRTSPKSGGEGQSKGKG
jgi:hypothetical protein